MKKNSSITSLPVAPEVERRHRMVRYSLAMGIRVPCIVSLLFLHGWWLLVPALGAIFLPYFAVVIANAASSRVQPVERPGHVMVAHPPTSPGGRSPK